MAIGTGGSSCCPEDKFSMGIVQHSHGYGGEESLVFGVADKTGFFLMNDFLMESGHFKVRFEEEG